MGEGGVYTGVGPLQSPVALFLVQLIIVIAISRGLSRLFRFLRQPLVIYEIIGGIILGPSVLGNLKGFSDTIFPTASLPKMQLIANMGLILYLFLIGMEIELEEMAQNFKRSAAISVTGVIFPFGLGIAVSKLMYDALLDDPTISFASFSVFLGVCMSITAFPVLARILIDQKLLKTKVGTIAISAAAVDDVIAWCLLALVISLLSAHGNELAALWVFLTLCAYAAFMLLVFRPYFAKAVKFMTKKESRKGLLFAMTFIFIFFSAYVTEILGVHAVFGGFLMGLTIPHGTKFAMDLTEKIEDFNSTVWLPLYFAFSGLRTNIGALSDSLSWGMFFLVLFVASVGKFGGCTIATKLQGATWRESATIGVFMNTKGLVEVVVLNLGLDVGVINVRIFTVMVMMAITTTFITSPLVSFIFPTSFRGFDNLEKGMEIEILPNIPPNPQNANDLGVISEEEQGPEHTIESAHPDAISNEVQNVVPKNQSHRVEVQDTGADTVCSDDTILDRVPSLEICIPFHSIEEASSLASILLCFGASSERLKVSIVRLLELSDSYLRDNILSMAHNHKDHHEYSIKFDSLLRMVSICSRMIAETEVNCAIRMSESSEFGRSVNAYSHATNSHVIILPLFRQRKKNEVAEEFTESDYIHYILDIGTGCKRPFALYLDSSNKVKKSNLSHTERICVIYTKCSAGVELLSLMKHIASKEHTHIHILALKIYENSDEAKQDEAKDENDEHLENFKRSAQCGEHSSLRIDLVRTNDQFIELMDFIVNENSIDSYTMISYPFDEQLPLGMIHTSTFFGSLGNAILLEEAITAALLVVHSPLSEQYSHQTASTSRLPSFLLGGIIPGDSVVLSTDPHPQPFSSFFRSNNNNSQKPSKKTTTSIVTSPSTNQPHHDRPSIVSE